MSDYPAPDDTKKRLEQQGIPPNDIEDKVNELRDTIGGAVKPANREAFLHVVAARKFGVDVGDLPTMESGSGGGGGELETLHCQDVTPEVAERASNTNYEWEGWLLRTFTYEKKGDERLGGTLLDKTGAANLMSFKTEGTRDLTETLAHELGQPVHVRLEDVQLFSPGGDFATVTYGQYASAESTTPTVDLAEAADALPDAAENAVDYDEFARIEGVVTDERRSEFKACADCGKSLGGLDDFKDSCPACGAARHSTREFHRVTVTDGGATLELSLPPDVAPGRDLSFHAIKAVAEWREGQDDWDDEYRAVWFEASDEKEYGTPAEELNDSPENANVPTEPTPENVVAAARDMGATETNSVPVDDLNNHFNGTGGEFDEALNAAMSEGPLFEPTLGEVRLLED